MKELTIPAEIGELDRVLDFVNAELEENDCPPKVQIQIDVAVEEIFVNIASYAYTPNHGSATIRVETEGDPKLLAVRFTDSGIRYNPLERADPDVSLDADDRGMGGLGIYMVKKSMDRLEYEYSGDRNILTLYKYI